MILLPGGVSPALSKEALVRKVYVVRLTDGEREQLVEIVRKFKGASQKVRRAQILLKADADGPGWTDQQIADELFVSYRTVTTHVTNILNKLGAGSRTEAAAIAVRDGLI
jgi:DNA-binding NarL/FixJ family response regulator